jgi:hypothetical protein
MPFQQSDSLCYYAFESYLEHPVLQAIFTRHGGVSPEPWNSLNLGSTVGDDLQHVSTNRQRALRAMNRDENSVYDVWQIHSATVVRTEVPRLEHQEHQRADAIITNQPSITLLMRFADCTPIFLFDPICKAIGLVHAGWKGTVDNVVGATVEAMHLTYGTHPGNLLAAIGPSIGPDHYQIGQDVIAQAQLAFGMDSNEVLLSNGESTHFDLWKANELQLQRAGVKHIENSKVCTACHLNDWYSHRAEKGRTGRFGALLALGNHI